MIDRGSGELRVKFSLWSIKYRRWKLRRGFSGNFQLWSGDGRPQNGLNRVYKTINSIDVQAKYRSHIHCPLLFRNFHSSCCHRIRQTFLVKKFFFTIPKYVSYTALWRRDSSPSFRDTYIRPFHLLKNGSPVSLLAFFSAFAELSFLSFEVLLFISPLRKRSLKAFMSTSQRPYFRTENTVLNSLGRMFIQTGRRR